LPQPTHETSPQQQWLSLARLAPLSSNRQLHEYEFAFIGIQSSFSTLLLFPRERWVNFVVMDQSNYQRNFDPCHIIALYT
jgi:hypothetical protein